MPLGGPGLVVAAVAPDVPALRHALAQATTAAGVGLGDRAK